MDNLLQIKDLSVNIENKQVLTGVSLNINAGETHVLMGPNGAGKTTTVKMLSCLAKPTSGDALVYGKSIVSEPIEVKKMIGISPQENAAAKKLTVAENLKFMCGIYGIKGEKAEENVQKIIRDFSAQEERSSAAISTVRRA